MFNYLFFLTSSYGELPRSVIADSTIYRKSTVETIFALCYKNEDEIIQKAEKILEKSAHAKEYSYVKGKIGDLTLCENNDDHDRFIITIYSDRKYLYDITNIQDSVDVEQFVNNINNKAVLISDNYNYYINNTFNGGSVFHMRVRTESSKLIKEFKRAANYFTKKNCTFIYSISKSYPNERLVIYKAPNCADIININPRNILSIISENVFSSYHHYLNSEIKDIVETQSILLHMTDDLQKHKQIAEKTMDIVCGKYNHGWADNKNSSLNEIVGRIGKDEQIVIVNKEHDCLFAISYGHNDETVLYYTTDSFTNPNCWRYPEDSNKTPKENHYFIVSLILCALQTIAFTALYFYTKASSGSSKRRYSLQA